MPASSTSTPSEPMEAAGTYFDGKVAIGHPARITSEAAVLVIRDLSGQEMVRWSPDEVRLADEQMERTDLRLKRVPPQRDRFVIADRRDGQWLFGVCPQVRGRDRRSWIRIIVYSAVAAVVLIALFEVLLPRVADQVARVIPPWLEVRLGNDVRQQMIHVLTSQRNASEKALSCTGADGQRALERLVDTLGATADPPLKARVLVVNSQIVNAFAIPGAQILLTRGLISFAQHPDELAGVVAHELGHVAYHHPTAVAIEQLGGNFIIGALVGGGTGGSSVGNAVARLVAARYSRHAELEADDFAATLMIKNGYDRGRLAMLLDRMEREHPDHAGRLPLLSTHPQMAERRATLSAINEAPSGVPALNAEEWQTLQRICD